MELVAIYSKHDKNCLILTCLIISPKFVGTCMYHRGRSPMVDFSHVGTCMYHRDVKILMANYLFTNNGCKPDCKYLNEEKQKYH